MRMPTNEDAVFPLPRREHVCQRLEPAHAAGLFYVLRACALWQSAFCAILKPWDLNKRISMIKTEERA